jgi:hypothetical protein
MSIPTTVLNYLLPNLNVVNKVLEELAPLLELRLGPGDAAAMFSLLIISSSSVGAQLDAADGYASIYGDSTQKLASVSIPHVPWGSHAADHGSRFVPSHCFVHSQPC